MEIADISNNLVKWIKETISGAGGKGAVLGLSGGIDSAVVAVLCKQAFPNSTMCIIMPCHSDREDQEHALLLANQFKIYTRIVELDNPYDALIKVLPDPVSNEKTRRLAGANIKSRLRMLTLYYFANHYNYLVTGTGNRSELSTGYFTKYGDSGVDLLPLANLVKKQVRDLAEYLKIPPVIIGKPPSAGLWKGQTDEVEMGITYDVLDNYLLTEDIDPDSKDRIDTLIRDSTHKRLFPPMAPRFFHEIEQNAIE
jgi:NAD+ synthase